MTARIGTRRKFANTSTCRESTYIRKAISHYNSLYARKLLEREYSKASQRLGAAHLEYLKETELLEELPGDL
jgi:hypothetical protein